MTPLDGGIGLLVLDGLLLRRVGIGGRFGAELVGAGDLLRPWQGGDDAGSVPTPTEWRVLTEARLAILDAGAAVRIARYPPLIAALTARAMQRAHRLAVTMAIIHQPRIELRLHMLLWHLADRWGRVRHDGIHLPVRLSHSILAELIAAQRPSVTVSLGRLTTHGLLQTTPDGWLLAGDPPPQLLEVQDLALGTPATLGVDRTD